MGPSTSSSASNRLPFLTNGHGAPHAVPWKLRNRYLEFKDACGLALLSKQFLSLRLAKMIHDRGASFGAVLDRAELKIGTSDSAASDCLPIAPLLRETQMFQFRQLLRRPSMRIDLNFVEFGSQAALGIDNRFTPRFDPLFKWLKQLPRVRGDRYVCMLQDSPEITGAEANVYDCHDCLVGAPPGGRFEAWSIASAASHQLGDHFVPIRLQGKGQEAWWMTVDCTQISAIFAAQVPDRSEVSTFLSQARENLIYPVMPLNQVLESFCESVGLGFELRRNRNGVVTYAITWPARAARDSSPEIRVSITPAHRNESNMPSIEFSE